MGSYRFSKATHKRLLQMRRSCVDQVGEIVPYIWLWEDKPKSRDTTILRELIDLGVLAEVERVSAQSARGRSGVRVTCRLVSYDRLVEVIEAAEYRNGAFRLRL